MSKAKRIFQLAQEVAAAYDLLNARRVGSGNSLIGIVVYNIFRNKAPRQVDGIFRKGQLVSAALYSLGHGGNDAQK